jgi:hypothetical protein
VAKETGLGAGLFIDQYDLSGDVGSVQNISSERGALDITGIDKSARERILGLNSGTLEFVAFHNPSTGQSHAVLSLNPTADILCTYCHGSTVGNVTASMSGKQIGYPGSRGQDGSYTHSLQVVSNTSVGIEWGQMLTSGKQTFTGAANGTSIDYGAVSTTNGAASYLHVMSFTGTSATFTVADSADNVSFAAITGLAHTAATAATKERLQTAAGATIRRYVRVQVTGTFSSCVAVLSFVRY